MVVWLESTAPRTMMIMGALLSDGDWRMVAEILIVSDAKEEGDD